MATKKTTEEKKDMSFEQALERLNAIADALEKDKPTLENALELYEEGISLLKSNMTKLKEAEAKITLLSKGE